MSTTEPAALAGLLENYYTCIEMVFVRISQFFENSLDDARWHKDLLDTLLKDGQPVSESPL